MPVWARTFSPSIRIVRPETVAARSELPKRGPPKVDVRRALPGGLGRRDRPQRGAGDDVVVAVAVDVAAVRRWTSARAEVVAAVALEAGERLVAEGERRRTGRCRAARGARAATRDAGDDAAAVEVRRPAAARRAVRQPASLGDEAHRDGARRRTGATATAGAAVGARPRTPRHPGR